MRNPSAKTVSVDQQHRFLLVLWIALFASVGLYYFVSFYLEPPTVRTDSTMTVVFLGLAAAFAVASIFVGLQFKSKALETKDMAKLRAGFVLGLVLAETVALFGLVLYLTNGWPHYWIFFVVAALVDLVHYPARSTVEEIAGLPSEVDTEARNPSGRAH